MSSVGAAPSAAVSVSSARAAASRKNGARSSGPKTAEGKARSAQNALKHGLRAQKHVVLPDEDGGEFRALETALIEELAPVGALQAVLAQRIAVAAWRHQRADRIEAEILGHQRGRDGDLGLAVIRDANGAGALPTLLRYRGGALAELTRSLRALKALQAEARAQAGAGAAARAPAPDPVRLAAARPAAAAQRPERPAARAKQPDEPERRRDPGERGRPADRAHPRGAPCLRDLGPAAVSPVPLPARDMLVIREAIARGDHPWSATTLDRAP
ncbi:MAG: hypothetical protein K0R41_1160 [Geminicoccaceae bacterium]|jgi:hypothetical protein|nr:hypothetical protein [Geminicoccaceae bacterium]